MTKAEHAPWAFIEHSPTLPSRGVVFGKPCDGELIDAAMAVPHKCNDAQCVGNCIRQRLELYDEMVDVFKEIHSDDGMFYALNTAPRARLHAALVTAEKLEETK